MKFTNHSTVILHYIVGGGRQYECTMHPKEHYNKNEIGKKAETMYEDNIVYL